ncbi:hypothetical protein BBO99_00001152 [Phytophthora kernoviae]|uniref:Cytidyltransferase-like domain-containing protein n=1 Tax=Phytophthora kernoviae TaxID=325452 RepID=A0A3R7H4E9_9STRA|nr:hypothetical protein BBI17_004083 [Phytophthora kernoviae]RLN84643.1 hypothetical protein BBO99_00001152 [Phytophthora kernoviae]
MVTFATSQRNRLYQILKRVGTLTTIAEDELALLKKLVDAEFGDVIKFLIEIETEASVPLICQKLSSLVKNGSPSKHRNLIRPKLPTQHPVWGIQYPLLKIAQNLEQLRGNNSESKDSTSSPNTSPSKKTDVIVLVSSGAYNPIHMLHIRAFYVARQYVESNYKFPVVGAFISPSHDTFVRVKNRRNPREMITKRHRLALIEAAVGSSSWIEVDKWEITRRRVTDYHSTLTHVREMCESHFPQYRFHIMYVCGCNTVVKLSHSALRDEGFGCTTVCRPAQTDMVIKHLGKTLAKTTTIVEDTGVLPCDLERATSFRVRQALVNIKAHANMIEMMVGKPVFQYFVKHDIGTECMGIQHVWIVEPALYKKHGINRRITREATDWLTIRRFKTTDVCIQELVSNGYDIWATDLSQDAVSLQEPTLKLPDRVAIVMGREADGAMLSAANKRVYLPIHGFADSLNLNVATGMVLLQLFTICPEARGAMLSNEREQLRDVWYRRMVKGGEDADAFIASPPAPFCDLRRPDDHRGAWMGGKVRRKIVAKEQAIQAQETAQIGK